MKKKKNRILNVHKYINDAHSHGGRLDLVTQRRAGSPRVAGEEEVMDQEDRNDKITSMIDQIKSWTVPIITRDDRNIPSLRGTGILINAGDLKLLLTDKHVIDDDKQGLFIPSNEKLKGIIAKVHFSSIKYSNLPDKKTAIDACICVLDEDTATCVNSSFIFAEMGNHLVLGQPFMDQSCIILGYPETKINRDKKRKTISACSTIDTD